MTDEEEVHSKRVSFHLSPADIIDLDALVSKGIFTHVSDAARAVMRRGIETIKKERGLA